MAPDVDESQRSSSLGSTEGPDYSSLYRNAALLVTQLQRDNLKLAQTMNGYLDQLIDKEKAIELITQQLSQSQAPLPDAQQDDRQSKRRSTEDIQEEKDFLMGRIEFLQKECDAAKQRERDLSTETAQLHAQIGELNAKCSFYETKYNFQLQDARQQLDHALAELSEAQRQNARLRNDMDSSTTNKSVEVKMLREELSNLRATEANLHETISSLEKELSVQKQAELSRIERSETFSARLDESEKLNSILTVLVDRAQEMLADVEKAVENLPTTIRERRTFKMRFEPLQALFNKAAREIMDGSPVSSPISETGPIPSPVTLSSPISPSSSSEMKPKGILKKRKLEVAIPSASSSPQKVVDSVLDTFIKPKNVTFSKQVMVNLEPGQLIVEHETYRFLRLNYLFVVCFFFLLIIPGTLVVMIKGTIPLILIKTTWLAGVLGGVLILKHPKIISK